MPTLRIGSFEPAGRPYPTGAPALAPRSAKLVVPDGAADDAESFPGLMALGPVAGERRARDWALVLQSMSIWHVLRRSHVGWVLLVRDEDYSKASRSIDRYEEENRDWPPRPVRERARHASSVAVPLAFAALIAFFFVTGPVALESGWFLRGTAVTSEMLGGRPWQAVTALTLHADSTHVLGNAISGSVFASAVQRRIGAGGAALAVLASGILGNVGNALWHRGVGDLGHRSIGASTAVFGAIGLLAATQIALNQPKRSDRERRPWTDVVAPLVGGLALLGALGAGGPTTDLGAHFFGFFAGFLLGLGIALPMRRAATASVDFGSRSGASHAITLGAGVPRGWVQAALGAVAIAVVAGAWQLALRR